MTTNDSCKYLSSLTNPHELLLDETICSQSSQRTRMSLSLLPRNSKCTRRTATERLFAESPMIAGRFFDRRESRRAPCTLFRNEAKFRKREADRSSSGRPRRRCVDGTTCAGDRIVRYETRSHADAEREKENEISSREPNVKPATDYFRRYPRRRSPNFFSTRTSFSDDFDSDFEDAKSPAKKTAVDAKKTCVVRQPIVLVRKLSERESTVSTSDTRRYRSNASPSTKEVRKRAGKRKLVTPPKNNSTIDEYFRSIKKSSTEDSENVDVCRSSVSARPRAGPDRRTIFDSLARTPPSRKSSCDEKNSPLSPLVERSEISVSETCPSDDDGSSFDAIFRDERVDDVGLRSFSQKKRKIYDDDDDVESNRKVRRLSSSGTSGGRIEPFDRDTALSVGSASEVGVARPSEFGAARPPESKRRPTSVNGRSYDRLRSKKDDPVSRVVADTHDVSKCVKLSTILDFPNDLGIARRNESEESDATGTHRFFKEPCPNSKRITGTRFVVDAFGYGPVADVTHYFLTHFHSDCYEGLDERFRYPVVCSTITARLVRLHLRVPKEYLKVVRVNESIAIEGAIVRVYDANHCPGSIMFLFSLPNGENILHVGHFRASCDMESLPCFWNVDIDRLYLDTTYCSPEYDFPGQQEAIASALNVIETHRRLDPKFLIVIGTCVIGKEKAWLRIAAVNDWNVWADGSLRKTLDCLRNEDIRRRMRAEPTDADLHLLPMHRVHEQSLRLHLSEFEGTFTRVLGLRLGGEQKSIETKADEDRKVVVRGVPYSEHSNYSELKRFVRYVKPKKIVPTVRPKRSFEAVASMFEEWCDLDAD